MGTNYYVKNSGVKCDHCGHESAPDLHIGKSSGGWYFSLHVIPESGLNTLEDWKSYLEIDGNEIVNEYNELLSVEEFLEIVTDRGRDCTLDDLEILSRYITIHTDTEIGNYSLFRPKIDGNHCLGHGEVWSYITGNFS